MTLNVARAKPDIFFFGKNKTRIALAGGNISKFQALQAKKSKLARGFAELESSAGCFAGKMNKILHIQLFHLFLQSYVW
jgi:ketopantoate reductase